MSRRNILMIWDRMGDYHRARWNETRRLINDRNVYAADLGGSDKLYGWTDTHEGDHIVFSKTDPGKFDFARITTFIGILKSLNIGHVCIAGYGRPEYLFFLIYSKLTGRRVLLFAESWYPSSRLVDKIKSVFLRWCCDGFLVSGERARKHFTNRLKIDASKIATGYSVVDNDHFSVSKPVERKKRVLCIGRFAPEKNLVTLINSFSKSALPAAGWELALVGGGPLHWQLESLAAGKPVALLNWQSYRDLPLLYSQASLFVLPSTFDPWGLVVNEAMAAGLPVVISDEVGCSPDLLEPGVNGWSFPARDENALKMIFDNISGKLPDLGAMGDRSKSIIGRYSLSLFAKNLKALLLRDVD